MLSSTRHFKKATSLLTETAYRFYSTNVVAEKKIAFIGLGNVGAKLAGTLVRAAPKLNAMITVADADTAMEEAFMNQFPADMRGRLNVAGGAENSILTNIAKENDVIITCLPSPAISAKVVEDGLIPGFKSCETSKQWLEMSSTDADEMNRLSNLISELSNSKVQSLDCPVSGGCHRAATGNISIFAGGPRDGFEKALPILTRLGRRVLHTGELGTASKLKVMTNYLATVHLCANAEAFAAMKNAGLDMATTYEAINISSGQSFSHPTESKIILGGSYDINFTMDLVLKDVGLFQKIADQGGKNDLKLELSPLILDIFKNGAERYGMRALSPSIWRRMEEQVGEFRADGFPQELIDDEPEEEGYEVFPPGRGPLEEQRKVA